jgi:hypothetical protein
MESLPIARPADELRDELEATVRHLLALIREQEQGRRAVFDWLRLDMAVEKLSQKLLGVANLEADTLTAEVKKVRGRCKPLSVAEVRALKEEHARSVVPLQRLAVAVCEAEQRVAGLVNSAYGLTPEEVALMWRTAPPRMPGTDQQG